nr:immunoglobulin light chain junction region [Macaca mulatta]MOX54599.1 immunoglobulin light chain junction region [Macaca mulatta]MOX55388.1 immunoglobulin light chain junction region [Macaca mulatta]
CHQYHNWITF